MECLEIIRYILTKYYGIVEYYGPYWNDVYNFAFTLPETNIAPKNGWLEYYFPIGEAYFQVLC